MEVRYNNRTGCIVICNKPKKTEGGNLGGNLGDTDPTLLSLSDLEEKGIVKKISEDKYKSLQGFNIEANTQLIIRQSQVLLLEHNIELYGILENHGKIIQSNEMSIPITDSDISSITMIENSELDNDGTIIVDSFLSSPGDKRSTIYQYSVLIANNIAIGNNTTVENKGNILVYKIFNIGVHNVQSSTLTGKFTNTGNISTNTLQISDSEYLVNKGTITPYNSANSGIVLMRLPPDGKSCATNTFDNAPNMPIYSTCNDADKDSIQKLSNVEYSSLVDFASQHSTQINFTSCSDGTTDHCFSTKGNLDIDGNTILNINKGEQLLIDYDLTINGKIVNNGVISYNTDPGTDGPSSKNTLNIENGGILMNNSTITYAHINVKRGFLFNEEKGDILCKDLVEGNNDNNDFTNITEIYNNASLSAFNNYSYIKENGKFINDKGGTLKLRYNMYLNNFRSYFSNAGHIFNTSDPQKDLIIGTGSQENGCKGGNYVDAGGILGPKIEITDDCFPPPKYSCLNTTGTCSVDPNGQYSTLTECNANCSPPPSKCTIYKTPSGGTCLLAAQTQNSSITIDGSGKNKYSPYMVCNITKNTNCDPSTLQVGDILNVNVDGTEGNTACDICKETKYTCIKGTCTPDPNGNSPQKCVSTCKPPIPPCGEYTTPDKGTCLIAAQLQNPNLTIPGDSKGNNKYSPYMVCNITKNTNCDPNTLKQGDILKVNVKGTKGNTACDMCRPPPLPPAPAYDPSQVKFWYHRSGYEATQFPKAEMITKGDNNTRKFNAIVFFTGAMGPNITDHTLQPKAYIDHDGTDKNTNWMKGVIGNPSDKAFKTNMANFFNLPINPINYKALPDNIFEKGTKKWLNLYGGITYIPAGQTKHLSYVGQSDLNWLSQKGVLQEYKNLGWDGLSLDLENINLGTDPIKAAKSITDFFDAIKANGLLGAVSTSLFGNTASMFNGFDKAGNPVPAYGLGNIDSLTTFIKELGQYKFDMYNPQLYDTDGLNLTQAVGTGNCGWPDYWPAPNTIAPVVPSNLATTFRGADNEGSSSGGFVFPGQGSSRSKGRGGFGLWSENNTITQNFAQIPITPICKAA